MGDAPPAAAVELAYLQSYENMGTADVACISGCACDPASFDANVPGERVSVRRPAALNVTQHPECVMAVTVSEHTSSSSGAHKIKLLGLDVRARTIDRHEG